MRKPDLHLLLVPTWTGTRQITAYRTRLRRWRRRTLTGELSTLRTRLGWPFPASTRIVATYRAEGIAVPVWVIESPMGTNEIVDGKVVLIIKEPGASS